MNSPTANKASSADLPISSASLDALVFDEAVSFHHAQDYGRAEALYRAAIALNANHAEANYNLGVLCHAQNRHEDAITAYRNAIFARLEYPDAYSNLGIVLKELGKMEEAEIFYRQALAYDPGHCLSHNNLGVLLSDTKRPVEARIHFRTAIALLPHYEWAYVNFATALLEPDLVQDCMAACGRAILLRPGMAIAHYNLGAALKTLNRLDEAVACFRQAIAIDENFAEAHFGMGQTLLMQEHYEEGWREYDWRWLQRDYGWLRDIHGEFAQPRWRGEDAAGKTILIYSEQGLGDAIQYARYVPRLLALGLKVVLAVHPPLKALFSRIPDVTIVGLGELPLPPFDLHCPLLGLPEIFHTDANSIPATVPYLSADPDKVKQWRTRLTGDGFRVGIIWAGNPAQAGDRWRSPRLRSVMPLFDVPGVDFVALQVGAGRDDMEQYPLPGHVLDLGQEIKDFADTAAIMTSLDLVITSCTAPLHMAGALNVPTWALIPFSPHFLWQLDRRDSPWYPSLTLYRQDKPGHDWSGAVERLGRDLAVAAQRTQKR